MILLIVAEIVHLEKPKIDINYIKQGMIAINN